MNNNFLLPIPEFIVAALAVFILLVGPFPFMRVINGGVADVLARFG